MNFLPNLTNPSNVSDPLHLESHPVVGCPDTTTFGIFGTSPESPDGKRICYTKFLHTPQAKQKAPIPGELWVCNRDLTHHRMLTPFEIKPVHNASRASWIENDRIAFSEHDQITVIDTNTGERIFDPIQGDLGHSARSDRLLFWSGNRNENGAVEEQDLETGICRTLVTATQIRACVESFTRESIPPFSVKHLQYNLDGSRIGFRLHGPRTDMLTMNGAGDDLQVYPAQKPVHQLWYDNDTVMGVWKRTESEGQDSHYFRWNFEGEVLESLAGRISHGAASADRAWYAGESCEYFSSPIRMSLYSHGETSPTGVCFDHSHEHITSNLRYHVNPAFSRDGRRLYFSQAVSNQKVEARFSDLSSLFPNG